MMDTLIIILPVIWASFTCYLLWFVTSAKRSVPITLEDAKTLWKIHKKNTKCACHKWRPLSRKSGKISGFECECGFKYTQRRPLLSGSPRASHRDHRSQTSFSVASYWVSFIFNEGSAHILRVPAETIFWNILHLASGHFLCLGTHPCKENCTFRFVHFWVRRDKTCRSAVSPSRWCSNYFLKRHIFHCQFLFSFRNCKALCPRF